MIGDRDYTWQMGGMRETEQGMIPKLKVVHIEEGTHFVQEQFPKQINELLIDFFTSHETA